jgi:hypothetical protein
MTSFGYTEADAEKVRNNLDLEMKSLEYRLDRIRLAVPQAGATTSRLDEARDIARGVVDDLHEEIAKRTEVPA